MRDGDSGRAESVKLRRKNIIIAVLALCVLGAVIYRWSHMAGTILTFAAISVYLVSDIKGTVNRAKNFNVIDSRNKWRFIMWCALLLAALSSLMSGRAPYFMVLVILAADYLMTGNDNIKSK